ncbi:MAG: MerR family transcriptional regulator [candidate division KSB1 bacterium]|nr:MerR family transcriptional regulator [candidate division KSB1 bacterium]MDZ7273658.1 MerR family transcriptional regulator [candidate division KSB1 bacterium]MDZ7285814.1 MerR family transcriptional regulator [candidate division KSB1 bacterium]MDZ7298846.1 MerR family transcriptional regulator [candidate division KSB1 bacterium]MDZ7308567.1 MerR family transcriptional regulator [candidate division KSB1 bacterium]
MSSLNLDTESRFKIRQVAAQLGIAVETIRMYERAGLLLPRRTASGQRVFSEADIHWIACLRRLLTERGLNLEGIRRMLALLPCWQIKPCSEIERNNCPAYLNAMQPCWMVKPQVAGACRTLPCHDCNVYKSAQHCDNLKALLRRYMAPCQQ